MGHAHFVEIGKEQGHPQGYGPGVFDDRIDLPAQVTAGSLNPREKVMVVAKVHDNSVIFKAPTRSRVEARRWVTPPGDFKSPFPKGGFSGIINRLFNPPYPPLETGCYT